MHDLELAADLAFKAASLALGLANYRRSGRKSAEPAERDPARERDER